MFRNVGFVLLFIGIFGGCSLKQAPVPTSNWYVTANGVVEHVGDDYIVVHFDRMRIVRHSPFHGGDSWRDIGITLIVKIFYSLKPDNNGIGTNYSLFHKVGDPVMLKFHGQKHLDPMWLALDRFAFLRKAEQSQLPPLQGDRRAKQ